MENIIEKNRIENLHKYEILDTPPDGAYDEITLLATKIFNVPIAIISIVDTERVWFKSTYGIDAEEVPRSSGLCGSAVMSDEIYVVEDARKDPRTIANPLVAGIMGFQFYAAAPLKTLDGYNLGTICIIDKEPRTLDIREKSMLYQLSRIVMDQMELKLQTRLLVKDLYDNQQKNNA